MKKINRKPFYNKETKDQKKSSRNGTAHGESWYKLPKSVRELDEREFGHIKPVTAKRGKHSRRPGL
jgi:hypothetical protein